jgi:hypothetical protein
LLLLGYRLAQQQPAFFRVGLLPYYFNEQRPRELRLARSQIGSGAL